MYSPGQDVKGMCGVWLDNRKALCAPGPRTKYFDRLFLLFNKLFGLKKSQVAIDLSGDLEIKPHVIHW